MVLAVHNSPCEPERNEDKANLAVTCPRAVFERLDNPFCLHATSEFHLQAAGIGQAPGEAIQRIVGIRERFVPAIKTDCEARTVDIEPDGKAIGILRRDTYEVLSDW